MRWKSHVRFGGRTGETHRSKDGRALRSDPYTEHPTRGGKVYLAVVLDAWNREVIGLSITDHLRAEIVCDALDMACWRRRPSAGSGLIHHADHGCQYTSWVFGQRLRAAGILGSMGTVGDALDNAMAESFFASLQVELLDRRRWDTRNQLAQAIFEWIEVFYNPVRRHSALDYHSPSPTANATTRPPPRWHDHHTQPVRETGGSPTGPLPRTW